MKWKWDAAARRFKKSDFKMMLGILQFQIFLYPF